MQHAAQQRLLLLLLEHFATELLEFVVSEFRIEDLFTDQVEEDRCGLSRGRADESVPMVLQRHRQRDVVLVEVFRELLLVGLGDAAHLQVSGRSFEQRVLIVGDRRGAIGGDQREEHIAASGRGTHDDPHAVLQNGFTNAETGVFPGRDDHGLIERRPDGQTVRSCDRNLCFAAFPRLIDIALAGCCRTLVPGIVDLFGCQRGPESRMAVAGDSGYGVVTGQALAEHLLQQCAGRCRHGVDDPAVEERVTDRAVAGQDVIREVVAPGRGALRGIDLVVCHPVAAASADVVEFFLLPADRCQIVQGRGEIRKSLEQLFARGAGCCHREVALVAQIPRIGDRRADFSAAHLGRNGLDEQLFAGFGYGVAQRSDGDAPVGDHHLELGAVVERIADLEHPGTRGVFERIDLEVAGLAGCDRRELFADFTLQFRRVEVSHGHDCRQFRHIPFPVVVFECGGRDASDVLDRAERQPPGMDSLADFQIVEGVSDVVSAQLLEDDAAFGFDPFGADFQTVQPVAQDQQGAVNDPLALGVGRHGEEVDRPVLTREGVDVHAVLHSERFEVALQRLVGEVARTAEGDVLQKMRTTLLPIKLLDRSGPQYKPEFDARGREVILAKDVVQTVGEYPFAGSLRQRQCLRLSL